MSQIELQQAQQQLAEWVERAVDGEEIVDFDEPLDDFREYNGIS